MNHPVKECEECGELRVLTPTIYGNVCGLCEQINENFEEEFDEYNEEDYD